MAGDIANLELASGTVRVSRNSSFSLVRNFVIGFGRRDRERFNMRAPFLCDRHRITVGARTHQVVGGSAPSRWRLRVLSPEAISRQLARERHSKVLDGKTAFTVARW